MFVIETFFNGTVLSKIEMIVEVKAPTSASGSHSFMNVRKTCIVHKEAQFPDCLRVSFLQKKNMFNGLGGPVSCI